MTNIEILVKYGITKKEKNNTIKILKSKPEDWKKITDVVGGIAIRINREWVTGTISTNVPYYAGDFLYYHIVCFLQAIKRLETMQFAECECLDAPAKFVFQRIGTKIKVSYFQFDEEIHSATINFLDFKNEIKRISEKFISDLETSPELRNTAEIQRLKELIKNCK